MMYRKQAGIHQHAHAHSLTQATRKHRVTLFETGELSV